jgi:hypothetical protein
VFPRTHRVGAYAYTELLDSYRDRDGKSQHRVIARWPAEHSLADELDRCEIEIITCKLWLYDHELLAGFAPFKLTEVQDGRVRRTVREMRYGATGYRQRLVRAQRRLSGLRKAARAAGITVRAGKLPARLMLGTDVLEHWQKDDLKEAKAAILLEMQRRQQREAARRIMQDRLRAAISGKAETKEAAARVALNRARSAIIGILRSHAADLVPAAHGPTSQQTRRSGVF